MHSAYGLPGYLVKEHIFNPNPDEVARAVVKITECLRVLKKKGKMIVWPSLNRSSVLEYSLKLDGWKMKTEEIDLMDNIRLSLDRPESARYFRTVIQR